MKTITESQFWQLVGIISAGRALKKQQDALELAYKEIVGGDEGRFIDYVYEYDNIVDSLKTHLPHDGVEVKWNDKYRKVIGK